MSAALASAETIPEPFAARLPALLAGLLAEERIRGGIFELRDTAHDTWTPVAFGLSAFLDPAATDAYLAAPVSDMTLHFLTRVAGGERGILLDARGIADGNSGRGLDLAALHYSQRLTDMTDPATLTVLSAAIQHFVAVHRGYRLARLFRVDPSFLADMSVQTGLSVVTQFPAGTPQSVSGVPLAMPKTLLGYVHDGPQPIGSFATVLFEYAPPTIGFSVAESRLLALAADGADDAEIARRLDISPHTVRQSWKAIFARTEARAPYALGPPDRSLREGTRGQEKRRHLLAYVRMHPSEMRPHRRPSKISAPRGSQTKTGNRAGS